MNGENLKNGTFIDEHQDLPRSTTRPSACVAWSVKMLPIVETPKTNFPASHKLSGLKMSTSEVNAFTGMIPVPEKNF